MSKSSENQVFLILLPLCINCQTNLVFLFICVLFFFFNEDEFLVMNMWKSVFSTVGTWLYKENQKIPASHSRSDSKCITSSTLYPFAEALCKSKTKRF